MNNWLKGLFSKKCDCEKDCGCEHKTEESSVAPSTEEPFAPVRESVITPVPDEPIAPVSEEAPKDDSVV